MLLIGSSSVLMNLICKLKLLKNVRMVLMVVVRSNLVRILNVYVRMLMRCVDNGMLLLNGLNVLKVDLLLMSRYGMLNVLCLFRCLICMISARKMCDLNISERRRNAMFGRVNVIRRGRTIGVRLNIGCVLVMIRITCVCLLYG